MAVTKVYIARRKINGHDENGKPKTYHPTDVIEHAESWGGPFRSMKSLKWIEERYVDDDELAKLRGENKVEEKVVCKNCEKEFKNARGLTTHLKKCESKETEEEEYEEVEVEVEIDENGNEIEVDPETEAPQITL